MTYNPLITVIISSYNHARYVEASIRSVLNQTYSNVELLVYDDGSSDDSPAIIQKLADQYGFFYHPQANQGLPRTLNDGIARARGTLIAPFGSDDIMFPDRLEKQVAWIEHHPEVGFFGGNVIKIDEHGDPLPQKRQRHHPERMLNFEDAFLERVEAPQTATLLFRKEAIEQVGGFDPDIRLEDLYIGLKITEAGWMMGAMEDTMAYYRVHPTNTVKNLHFMQQAVLKTYACFSHHPSYPDVLAAWFNHQFLKAANRDKKLALECLKQLPLSYWNMKTLRGIWRLLTERERPPATAPK